MEKQVTEAAVEAQGIKHQRRKVMRWTLFLLTSKNPSVEDDDGDNENPKASSSTSIEAVHEKGW